MPRFSTHKWLCEKPPKWILCQTTFRIILRREILSTKECVMRYRPQSRPIILALLLSLTLLTASSGSQNQASDAQGKKVVYVCACLKTKSCACMTEAKMEGPCACGTEGGPPLKAVPSDSAWAKENRDALAK
jgi:hypothetical protein